MVTQVTAVIGYTETNWNDKVISSYSFVVSNSYDSCLIEANDDLAKKLQQNPLKVGDIINVELQLRCTSSEKDGIKRYFNRVRATSVFHISTQK